jgi:uncharacterized membrane protein YbhN (UPF0104 family)
VALKLAVAAAILTWLLASGQLDISRIWAIRNGGALAALIACKLAATTLPAVRWYVMTRGLGLELSLPSAIHIGLIGNFLSTAAPGMLGQDGARLAYGRSLKLGSGARLVSTVLADRIAGLAALIGLAITLSAVYLAVAGIVPMERLVLLGVLVAVLVVGIGAGLMRLNLPSLRGFLWRPIQALAAALSEYRHQPKALAIALTLSVASHMAAFAGFYFGFASLGAAPPLLPVLALSPALVLVCAIPTTPLSLGVTDWFGEVLYSGMDLSDGAEMVMLTRLVTLGIDAACGIPFLFPVRMRGADEAK